MDAHTKRVFTRDFREQAVTQVLAQGKGLAQASRDLGINVKTYSRWVQLARAGLLGEVDASRVQPVSELVAENARLKKELAEAREDRDILKKASAYFARHQK